MYTYKTGAKINKKPRDHVLRILNVSESAAPFYLPSEKMKKFKFDLLAVQNNRWIKTCLLSALCLCITIISVICFERSMHHVYSSHLSSNKKLIRSGSLQSPNISLENTSTMTPTLVPSLFPIRSKENITEFSRLHQYFRPDKNFSQQVFQTLVSGPGENRSRTGSEVTVKISERKSKIDTIKDRKQNAGKTNQSQKVEAPPRQVMTLSAQEKNRKGAKIDGIARQRVTRRQNQLRRLRKKT